MHTTPQSKRDYCTRAGAEALAAEIADYWRRRGFEIHVTLHDTGYDRANRGVRWDVRSTLVNAMPPRAENPKRIRRAA